MIINLFWNTEAFITFIIIFAVSAILHYKREKMLSIISLMQVNAVIITLIYLIISLANLTSMQKLGTILSYAILLNLYACICNVVCRIYLIFKTSL